MTGQRGERGAAGLLLVTGIGLALAGVVIVVSVFVAWFACIRKAEATAELAALAAVSASVRGDDPCAAADDAARRNGLAASACEVRGGGGNVVVEVSVIAELTPRLWAGPAQVARSATAGT